MILVDGDILVYRVACAAEGEPEQLALRNLDSYTAGVLCMCSEELEEYKIFLSGASEDNFRHKYAVTAGYKAGRKEKPEHFEAVRKAMIEEWSGIVCDGEEADDAIAYTATALTEENKKAVIASIDKDLLQIPGMHYNFVKHEWTVQSDEDALRLLYCQVLSGDAVDNIKGIHRVGQKTAQKMLAPCEDTGDLLEREKCYYTACVKAYMDREKLKFPAAVKRVYEVARLVYLRREPGEIWIDPYERGKDVPKET